MKKKPPGLHDTSKADVGLGQRVRLVRIEKQISQETLGKALGVSFQQVQKYEKGVNRIGANRLQQIADALDVSVADFFEGATKERTEVQGLMFTNTRFSLRLLRAYAAIKDHGVQKRFVHLLESVAGIRAEENG